MPGEARHRFRLCARTDGEGCGRSMLVHTTELVARRIFTWSPTRNRHSIAAFPAAVERSTSLQIDRGAAVVRDSGRCATPPELIQAASGHARESGPRPVEVPVSPAEPY
jgi:hypothetical protein